MRLRSDASRGDSSASTWRKISTGSTGISPASFWPWRVEQDVHDAPVLLGPPAFHEPLALHAIDDPGDRAVPRADALRELRERELADGLEHLDHASWGPVSPYRPASPFVMRRLSV